jgi:hypothetical protein
MKPEAKPKNKAMKILQKTLAFLSICISITFAHAQNINCNDLSILGFGPDAFHSGNTLLHIHLEGDAMDFISYPHVSIVTDCNGDTVATGSMNFFGQTGQSVQSYPVTGDITDACLPITVEFVYGNTNFETDTCILSLSALPAALICGDFIPIDIEADQSNTLVNISMQGTGNTYISNPHITFVTDCTGDTVATGFINSSGQTGLTTQGYPITAPGNSVCYPITVEFIYGNTNFETDTCLLTLNGANGIPESSILENKFSIFPNPASNEITIQTDKALDEKYYHIYDHQGKLILTGKLLSANTIVDIGNFSNGFYLVKTDNHVGEIFKVLKQ